MLPILSDYKKYKAYFTYRVRAESIIEHFIDLLLPHELFLDLIFGVRDCISVLVFLQRLNVAALIPSLSSLIDVLILRTLVILPIVVRLILFLVQNFRIIPSNHFIVIHLLLLVVLLRVILKGLAHSSFIQQFLNNIVCSGVARFIVERLFLILRVVLLVSLTCILV